MERPPPNNESRAGGIVASAIVMIVVPTLAAILRFWSRAALMKMRFWWDDWAILATLICSHLFLAMTIYWTTIGLGKHASALPLDSVKPNAIVNRVCLVFYAACIWLVKISALLLYARVFEVKRGFITVLWVVGAVSTAWWIFMTIYPWSACHPIQKNVDPFIEGHCDKATGWYMSSAFINAFMDLVVLLLPMPEVWRTKMTIRRRVLVSLVFLLGYCSAFLSFARFIIIVRNPNMLTANSPNADPSWDLVPLLHLSMLEAPLAILALCGPSINQLVARKLKHHNLRSIFSSQPRSYLLSGSRRQSDEGHKVSKGSFNEMRHSAEGNDSGVELGRATTGHTTIVDRNRV